MYASFNELDTGYNDLFHKAIRKYGKDNFIFEIVYQSTDKDHTLCFMESYFINEYKSHYSQNGYNMTLGGEALMLGRKFSDEHRQKISLANKGKHGPGRKWSKEAKNSRCGENNPAIQLRQKYQIYFENGTMIEILGFKKWCRDNGYNQKLLRSVLNGTAKYHKDIVKVIKL